MRTGETSVLSVTLFDFGECVMSVMKDQDGSANIWLNPWKEIEGSPNPEAIETVDASIRRIMVVQKREQSRKALPDLDPN